MAGRPDVCGRAAITDDGNGRYHCTYSVPMPGCFEVHVVHLDLGSDAPSHVRGSPFVVVCRDPWDQPRLLGTLPQKRKAATLLPVGKFVVLFGGDKSGPFLLDTTEGDWRWTPAPLPPGSAAPLSRVGHAAVQHGDDAMIVFAGVSMLDQTELADLWRLRCQDGEFAWETAPAVRPFQRQLKRALAEQQNVLPEPRAVPEQGMHIQLTDRQGHSCWLSDHRWSAGATHVVQLTNVDPDVYQAVHFFVNKEGADVDAEPDRICTRSPFVMGTAEDGSAEAWEFEEGHLSITALAIPHSTVDGHKACVVTEAGAVLPAGGVQVHARAARMSPDMRLASATHDACLIAPRCYLARDNAAFSRNLAQRDGAAVLLLWRPLSSSRPERRAGAH